MQAKVYNSADWTWGYELEIGDVPKSFPIPKKLGAWEYAERDIVNLLPPYQYIAADPLGIDPPVGGEINTAPTKSIDEQINNLDKLLTLFRKSGHKPTVACLMEGHVHVHIPGLTGDVNALKKLTRYISANQHTIVTKCGQYKEHPLMQRTKTARTYLKWDMGRTMPAWMVDNIQRCSSFDEFIAIQCCGKDGISRGRPIRYVVNTYCLKHTKTIEFRAFRATLDLELIRNCFEFVKKFLEAALNDGPTASQIIESHDIKFPPFYYCHEEYIGWERTKKGPNSGKKCRKFVQVV